MKRLYYTGLVALSLVLLGCAGGGGGSSDDAPLSVCSLDPALDRALDDAVSLWQGHAVTRTIPNGFFAPHITIAHEIGHVLAARIDHVDNVASLMHAHHNPRQDALTDADYAYTGGKADVVVTEDVTACDVTVRFGTMGMDNHCPAQASGCWEGDTITLSETKRWAVIRSR